MSDDNKKKGSKKKSNKLRRVITKPLRLPINWALPRSTVGAVKEFKFSDSRYPICPNCTLSRFEVSEDTDDSGLYEWSCPSCEYKVHTKEASLPAIQTWYHHNAKEVYKNSPYQQKRRQADSADGSSFVSVNVRRNMIGSYILLGFSIIMLLLFLFAAWTTDFFFMLNTLIFAAATAFLGLSFNYRAWQAQTNNIYSKDGKKQFHWWVKNHPWFRYPKDIGQPPTTTATTNNKD